MARAPRQDFPGAWHHVVNRGIARRPLFEHKDDVRYFLSRLAKEVRRGRLEVHAWCALTTHFHLLVRSPAGELSEAMRRAENEYSRYFNRKHRRDGTLIRGRFLSRPVQSLNYRRAVIRYIDANPVSAGLVAEGWQYPWGSAASYVGSDYPSWLERSWIEGEVAASAEQGVFSPENYISVFGSCGEGVERLVDARLSRTFAGCDDLDDLVGSAPEGVRRWMIRKARLADGLTPGQPVCDVQTVLATLQGALAGQEWNVRALRRLRDAARIARVGLLRSLAAMTWVQVSLSCSMPAAKCRHEFLLHGMLMQQDLEYSRRITDITSAAIANCLRQASSPRQPRPSVARTSSWEPLRRFGTGIARHSGTSRTPGARTPREPDPARQPQRQDQRRRTGPFDA